MLTPTDNIISIVFKTYSSFVFYVMFTTIKGLIKGWVYLVMFNDMFFFVSAVTEMLVIPIVIFTTRDHFAVRKEKKYQHCRDGNRLYIVSMLCVLPTQ